MSKDGVYIWSEAVMAAYPELAAAPPQAEVPMVVTYARNFGVGTPISRQKTHYSLTQLSHLGTLLSWWALLLDTCNVSTASKTCTRALIHSLTESITSSRPLPIFAIFCPSYRIGIGKVGFETKIGKHTSEVISQLLSFLRSSERAGLPIRTEVYFCDMLLENYDHLEETDYRHDLDLDYESFRQAFMASPVTGVSVQKLSSLSALTSVIGERGVEDSETPHDPKLFNHVHLRNRAFYSEQLGWDEERILRRTRVLYSSYAEIGRFFRSRNPQYVIYWTESAYERAPMYSAALPKSHPIPVIYPQK